MIDCADCRHYVGHGITGTLGMAVTRGAAAREDRAAARASRPTTFNARRRHDPGAVLLRRDTVYRVKLASGQVLAVSMANTERQRDDAFTRGDAVWATWSPQAHVVLTQ